MTAAEKSDEADSPPPPSAHDQLRGRARWRAARIREPGGACGHVPTVTAVERSPRDVGAYAGRGPAKPDRPASLRPRASSTVARNALASRARAGPPWACGRLVPRCLARAWALVGPASYSAARGARQRWRADAKGRSAIVGQGDAVVGPATRAGGAGGRACRPRRRYPAIARGPNRRVPPNAPLS